MVEQRREVYLAVRRLPGHCPNCGYDRSDLPTDALCPECGRARAS